MKAVQFDKYGSVDELYIADLPQPVAGSGHVVVKVKAAGINPGEASIREGRLAQQYPTAFPSGQGSDFAGIVEAIGDSVSSFAKGDEVIGFTNKRGSHAEYVLVPDGHLIPKPGNVTWEQGGSLFVAGSTAYAAVRAVNLEAGNTVVIAGAAGGVGSIAVQLAIHKGATVVGIASKDNHEWLTKHGVKPVAYGDHMEDDIKQAANGRIDAFIDLFGKGYVDLAIKLGVPAERINTIIDFEAVKKYGIHADGSAKAATTQVLSELALLMEQGKLEIPIAATYPLSEVHEAYKELEQRHTHGKIVLTP